MTEEEKKALSLTMDSSIRLQAEMILTLLQMENRSDVALSSIISSLTAAQPVAV